MREGFFYKERFYIGWVPLPGTNIENWTEGYNRAKDKFISEFLEFLKGIRRCPICLCTLEEVIKEIKKWEKRL